MSDAPILIIGDVMTDVIAAVANPLALGSDTAAQVRTRQGGAGANVAAWLGRHGVPTVFVGVVGEDPFGVEAVTALQRCGVTSLIRVTGHAATGTCVILVGPDGERTMLPDAGANSLLEPTDVPDDVISRSGHLHVSGYSLLNPGSRDAAVSALRRATRAGIQTSVDPASAAPLEAVGAEAFRVLTQDVSLVLVTLDEAEVLCDSRDPTVIGARLTATYDEVVIKLGPAGARWCSRADPSGVDVPMVVPTSPVIDTTGAGDAFAAAWLAARRRGAAPMAALTAATESAAIVVTTAGARDS